MSTKPKIIVIVGPTASGKTSLAIGTARRYHGQIISADSRQIYRGMTIGTAQPTKEQRQQVKHHLIGCINPNQPFSLANFIQLTNKKITYLFHKNITPIIVGGTGLYVSALIDNYQLPKGEIDLALRKKLEQKTPQQLIALLRKKDPQTAQIIDQNNKRRLVRALEYVLTNKKSFTANQQKNTSNYQYQIIGLNPGKEKLEQNIRQRTKEMIKQGLVAETRELLKKYSSSLPALQTIGYQEIIQYLDGKISLTQAEELINIHTRQYAKRQMTWFKRDQRIKWQ
ncbi:MAG: tRNA (adenosine(37)-N6)-dimethylallyltransferase MiaA [Candidatus Komeilibacteria bacterium CG_4_10_14_0_2_um_filter_37_10]|uniref:tRNA dimethylallyltransferase n=1 Tax=Candidatus Komeilibacteria bacterium CG_4_10_14_0_2_um_filter_37_10 TaxID=1974470 RepID=A0A2M7VE19_9BACT|nr:MAG: tRNA (adenosine(37)-N6)-dimethylallyltransferase MiaA [Candidatus Komeilibacteria bacterium CG_4_10_14_0_2_um_filter_37_10]